MKAATVTLLFCMASLPALAQGEAICDESMSVNQCKSAVIQKINPHNATVDSRKKSAIAVADKTVALTNTAGAEQAAIDDFVARLLSFVNVKDATGSSDKTFRFEWVNPFGKLPYGHAYKVTAAAEEAHVFAPLAASIGDTAAAPLENDISSADNLSVAVSYSINNKRYGRNIQEHEALFSKVLDEAYKDRLAEADAAHEKYRAVDRFAFVTLRIDKKTPLSELAWDDYKGKISPDDCVPAILSRDEVDAALLRHESEDQLNLSCFRKFKALFIRAVEEKKIADETALLAIDSALDRGDYGKLTRLLNNQPQLIFKASATSRSNVVGPDEYSLSFRWEEGFTNLDTLQDICGTNMDYGCVTTELAKLDEKSIAANNRAFVSLEYSKRDDYSFTRATPAINFSLEGSESLIASAGYGRYISVANASANQARIDISVSYSHQSGQAADVQAGLRRNNQLKYEVNYSQKISGDVALVCGISHTNKPEYQGQVQEGGSALNCGINYKLAGAE